MRFVAKLFLGFAHETEKVAQQCSMCQIKILALKIGNYGDIHDMYCEVVKEISSSHPGEKTGVEESIMSKLKPITPGEILSEEFLKPMTSPLHPPTVSLLILKE